MTHRDLKKSRDGFRDLADTAPRVEGRSSYDSPIFMTAPTFYPHLIEAEERRKEARESRLKSIEDRLLALERKVEGKA